MTSKRLLGVMVTALAVALPATAAVAATADGPLLWYKFDETSGTVVADASGHGRDGTLVGGGTWNDGLALDGVDDHVDMPDDLLAGLDAITVTAEVYIEPEQSGAYFIYGLGNSSGDWGDGYVFTTGNGYKSSISTCHWTCEQNTSSGQNLARGTWNHLAYTLEGGTAVLYLNGQEVDRNEAVTLKPGDIGAGATTANYLGRSLYSGDRYFKGRFADFRIYDGALTSAEVGEQAAHISAEKAAEDAAAIDLGDTTAVTGDLDLPTQGANGSQITWASSDPEVIGTDGTVTRPAMDGDDAAVTLTATVILGTVQEERDFTATVLAEYDDEEAVELDAAAVLIPNLDDVRSSINLPTEGANGSSITWKSSKPGVIATDGVVERAEPGGKTQKVKLTATVTRGREKEKLDFTATVPPLPAEADYTGYFFTYFTGEGTPTGEQIYGALSDGNDPLSFTELNSTATGSAAPILTSDQGEQGVRDPFLIRSPEGDRFFLIATDLKINGNGDWNRAQRHGSLSIMVWESDDLVNWSEEPARRGLARDRRRHLGPRGLLGPRTERLRRLLGLAALHHRRPLGGLLPPHDVRDDPRLRALLRGAGLGRPGLLHHRLDHDRVGRHLLPLHQGRAVQLLLEPVRQVHPRRDRHFPCGGCGVAVPRRLRRFGRHQRGGGPADLQVQHRGEVAPLHRRVRRPGLCALRDHRPRFR